MTTLAEFGLLNEDLTQVPPGRKILGTYSRWEEVQSCILRTRKDHPDELIYIDPLPGGQKVVSIREVEA
jgi:hypothetical protein